MPITNHARRECVRIPRITVPASAAYSIAPPDAAIRGSYRLCWCAEGFDCTIPGAFAVDVGPLTMVGPYLACDVNLNGYSDCAEQSRDVVGGTPFVLDGIRGVGLKDLPRASPRLDASV